MKTKRLTWMRGIISLLVCLAMIMPAGTAMKAQAEEKPTSGTCGENVTWSLDTGTGVLTISGSGPMKNYNISSSTFWFDNRIKKVKIEQGVTSIGDYAFDNCQNLKGVEIPNSVTSIGRGAFCTCWNLTTIEIPNSVTSIGAVAFADCSKLASIDISNSLISIENGTFWGCTSLTSIVIPNSVYSIGKEAFRECSSLSSIEIPDSVTNIGNFVFSGCSSLSSVVIPNSVTSIGFYNCTGLVSVVIPNSVTSIDFSGCTGLVNVVIPDSVHEFCFNNCNNLTSITMPDMVHIADNTFDGCEKLTAVGSVTTVGKESFKNCKALAEVKLYDDPSSYYTKVETIPESAFIGCTALKKIVIPDTVTTIETNAFRYCNSLETVVVHGDSKTLADFTVKGYNDAFSNATFVNEPHDETSEVTLQPTKTSTGTRTYTCKICGHKRTEKISALEEDPTPNPQPTPTPDPQPDKPSSDSPFSEDFSPAMIEEAVIYPNTTADPSTLNCKFYHQNGKSYWYEGGVRQGTYDDPKGVIGDGTVRGREVCDMETAAWYWCDSVYNGAKAVNKEVWMPYIYQNEKTWSDDEIRQNAAASKDEHADMSAQLERDIKAHTGKWVRYNANGKMFKGWYKVTASEAQYYPDQVGNIYYYDPKTGLMAKGDLTIDGVAYHFDETSGVLQK